MKKMISILTTGIVLMSAASNALAAGFITGGDMTEVSYIEDLGGVYKDFDGNKVDPFEFMASEGVNTARIRLSNHPGKGRGDGTYYLPEGYQDEDDCFELCKRAKKAGMGIQFTFNYSDYWSNGERQIIPADWVEQIKTDLGYDIKDASFLNSMTSAQRTEIQSKLGDILYDYTKSYMLRLEAEHIYPEYVSLGNEINGGMFFPFANTYAANMNSERFELVWDDNVDEQNDIKCPEDWAGLTGILNRGYDAVKEVSPDSKVVIHLASGSKDSVFTWFFDKYKNNGGKFDVIGASYYPAWSYNPIETCAMFCKNISARYNKDILIMETGYNWSQNKKNSHPGQLSPIDGDRKNAEGYPEKYPYTPEGHKNFLKDLFTALSAPECRCLGVLYWDPCMIHVEDPDNENESLSGWAYYESNDLPAGNVVENTTLFDFDGKALSAFEAFEFDYGKVTGTVWEEMGDGETWIKAMIKNGFTEAKKAWLIVAQYSDGKLTGVSTSHQEVDAISSASLEVKKPDGAYKPFLWNGVTLEPVEQEAQ